MVNRNNEAIVLCGGLGTRLRSVVTTVPKCLAPVAGRPFLSYLLDRLAEQGVRRVVLATGYMADKVEEFVAERWKGMEVVHSREQVRLGTGGAVRDAAVHITQRRFIVMNGDSFAELNYSELLAALEPPGVHIAMALKHVSDATRYGLVDFDGEHITGLHEKGVAGPGYINAGVYALEDTALKSMPMHGPFSFETQCLAPAVSRGEVVGLAATEAFVDIGIPKDYARAAEVCQMAPDNDR